MNNLTNEEQIITNNFLCEICDEYNLILEDNYVRQVLNIGFKFHNKNEKYIKTELIKKITEIYDRLTEIYFDEDDITNKCALNIIEADNVAYLLFDNKKIYSINF
ncbi:MAG: hypothetical protein ACTSRG_21905 [Candidatus Helarchaeota archaeon]